MTATYSALWFCQVVKVWLVCIAQLTPIVSLPLTQTVEYGARNAKIMGSIPRECINWSNVLYPSGVYIPAPGGPPSSAV